MNKRSVLAVTAGLSCQNACPCTSESGQCSSAYEQKRKLNLCDGRLEVHFQVFGMKSRMAYGIPVQAPHYPGTNSPFQGRQKTSQETVSRKEGKNAEAGLSSSTCDNCSEARRGYRGMNRVLTSNHRFLRRQQFTQLDLALQMPTTYGTVRGHTRCSSFDYLTTVAVARSAVQCSRN